jgi:phosphatidate cytidylyltransferase
VIAYRTPKEKGDSMLTRILTAVALIPIVVALVFYRGGLPFTVLVGLAAIIGLFEFYGGARKGGMKPNLILGVLAGLLFLYFGGWKHSDLRYLTPIFTGFLLLTLMRELFRGDHRSPFRNIGATIFGTSYVVWLCLHFIWLRQNAEGIIKVGPWYSERGAWLIMLVFLTTWAVDTGAYFVGKFYGKTKLAPKLSPGKTIEGSVGGFTVAVIIGAIVGAIIHLPQPHGLILGALMGIAAQLGDLTESAMKREVGIKDFGALMPGHGGMLDRLDSLLFTGPITFWYIAAFLPGWLKFSGQ